MHFAQMQQIWDKQSKVMDTTQNKYVKELEQLGQDMNDSFDRQHKQQLQVYRTSKKVQWTVTSTVRIQ